jgi:hypothetical protein
MFADTSEERPRAIFVDGSYLYGGVFNKVFYSHYKVGKVELVHGVWLRAKQTNNLV